LKPWTMSLSAHARNTATVCTAWLIACEVFSSMTLIIETLSENVRGDRNTRLKITVFVCV